MNMQPSGSSVLPVSHHGVPRHGAHPGHTHRRLVTTLACACGLAAGALAQCNTNWLATDHGAQQWGPIQLNEVRTIDRWDPDGSGPLGTRMVFGGSFDLLGRDAPRLVAFDPATGIWSRIGATLSRTNGIALVQSVLGMPNGDLIVGGYFDSAGSTTLNNIARFNGTSLQPLGAGLSGTVNTMVLRPNGRVAVASGGRVREFDGTTWNLVGSGVQTAEHLLQRPNGNLLAIGSLVGAQGGWLIEFDGTQWNVVNAGAAPSGQVLRTFLRANGDFVIAGNFYGVGGVAAPGIAVLANGVWSSLGGGVTAAGSLLASVEDITELPGGDLVAIGNFSFAGGVPAEGVARWNGATWSPLGPGFHSGPKAIATLPDGRLIASGALLADDPGQPTAWLLDGGSWVAPFRGLTGVARLQALADGGLVAIGDGQGPLRGGSAKLETTTSFWQPLPPNGPGGPWCIEPPTNFYVTQNYGLLMGWQSTGAQPTFRIDQLFGSWQTLAFANQAVMALSYMPNGDLVAAGRFTVIGGAQANAVARFNGVAWQPLGLGLQGPSVMVEDLLVTRSGELVAVGTFTHAGGVPAAGVAVFDGTNWRAPGGGLTNMVSPARVVQLEDGSIVVGGYGNDSLQRLVGLGTASEQWSSMNIGVGAIVQAMLALPGGDLLVGGAFINAGGSGADNIARVHAGTWQTVGTGFSGYVWDLAMTAGGEIWVAGDGVINGVSSAGITRLITNCPASVQAIGVGCMGSPNSLTAANLPWLGSTFRAEATWASGAAAGILGFAPLLPPTPIAPFLPSDPSCELLIVPDAIVPLVPVNQLLTFEVPLPSNPTLVGVQIFHQMLPLDLDPAGNVLNAYATNALQLTTGIF